MRYTKKDIMKNLDAMFIGLWVVILHIFLQMLQLGLEFLKTERVLILNIQMVVVAGLMIFVMEKSVKLMKK